jgi:hypothetical protein
VTTPLPTISAFCALIARPKNIGAIAFSPALAEAIARRSIPNAGPVLEVGPYRRDHQAFCSAGRPTLTLVE